MKIIKKLSDINKEETFALTIGNFDGVHRGHQKILNRIKNKCLDHNLKLVVITFVPHPLQLLRPSDNFLVNSYVEKRELLEFVGADYILEMEFTRDFSTQSPEEFLDNNVLTHVGLKYFYLGHDFAFGANKAGNFEFAKDYCAKRNVSIELLDEFKIDKESVSSSIIREYLSKGDIEKANDCLGREFFISGLVIKGEGRGKQIGFPTANLNYSEKRVIPSRGVYISETIVNGKKYGSITNIGYNPTFNSGHDIHVETHLLNFSDDIYGNQMRVFFISKIREERKFNSVVELVDQINKDVEIADKYFENT